MKYICLVGCILTPLDGYMAVCLVLRIDVHDISKAAESKQNKQEVSRTVVLTLKLVFSECTNDKTRR